MTDIDSESLQGKALEDALVQHPTWEFDPGRPAMSRDFEFVDFRTAFAFMTEMALFAERHRHHPEWTNVYNQVRIVLTTHDAAGLTAKDFRFARAADKSFSRMIN